MLEAIKRRNDVDVITGSYQRAWIEEEVARREREFEQVRFHYVEPPGFRRVENSGFWKWQDRHPVLTPAYHWYYRSWMRAAYRVVTVLHAREQFDLVHQLTFVGFRFPGHLWELGIPFVWGPIGGLENTPWRLLPAMGPRGAAYYAARNLVNSWHKRFLIAPRRALARATGIIAATTGIQTELRRWFQVPSVVISEVSAPAEIAQQITLRAAGEPMRIAWSARHLPGKALNLLLRALAHLPERTEWRLEIYGDGPARPRWERLSRRLKIDRRCVWHGQTTREIAIQGLREVHVFAITSLKDLTSTVAIEALSQGVPIICPDHCGFADAVTSECGIRIPVLSIAEFEQGIVHALLELESDEARRRSLARGALRRAADYSLEAKSAAIARVLDRAVQHGTAIAVDQIEILEGAVEAPIGRTNDG
jgi:glycosyltransferase involved in cell wall biosynthesis